MTNPGPARAHEILLVEDNPDDVDLTVETFGEVGMASTLRVVPDGVEAMAFLRRQGRYAGAACPDLILLDLNLPRKDGQEVLQEIKGDPDLRSIPVIVLSISRAREDVERAYDLHANCYITKPVDLDEFTEAVRGIERFWLRLARLPR